MILKIVYQIYTTIRSTEVLKRWRNVMRKYFKKLKSLLNLTRVTRTEKEILNIKVNTGKKIKQIWKQLKKKNENCKLHDINHSEKLSGTN